VPPFFCFISLDYFQLMAAGLVCAGFVNAVLVKAFNANFWL